MTNTKDKYTKKGYSAFPAEIMQTEVNSAFYGGYSHLRINTDPVSSRAPVHTPWMVWSVWDRLKINRTTHAHHSLRNTLPSAAVCFQHCLPQFA